MWQLKIKSNITQKRSQLVLRSQHESYVYFAREIILNQHWILQLVAGRELLLWCPLQQQHNTFWLLLWQQRYIAGCKFPTLNSTVQWHFQQRDRLCDWSSPCVSCFLHVIEVQIIASLVCVLNNFDGLKNFR